MGRPYNKKTVEDAALLAETMASNPHLGDMQWVALFLGIRESSTAYKLAVEAFVAADHFIEVDSDEESWVEAAALIADGWQIGDKVVLFNHVDVIADENVPQDRAYVYMLSENADDAITHTGVIYNVFHIDEPAVTEIDDSPMVDAMKAKVSTALEAMTTAPVETETTIPPFTTDVMPIEDVIADTAVQQYNPFDNFAAQDDDGE